MASAKPTYSIHDVARLGDELYDAEIQPRLSPNDDGKLVAIDVNSGSYVLDTDELSAYRRLRDRFPEAQIWLKRIGSPYVRRLVPCPD